MRGNELGCFYYVPRLILLGLIIFALAFLYTTFFGTALNPRSTLNGQYSGIVNQVVFSPDGKTLAIRGVKVALWDVASGV